MEFTYKLLPVQLQLKNSTKAPAGIYSVGVFFEFVKFLNAQVCGWIVECFLITQR